MNSALNEFLIVLIVFLAYWTAVTIFRRKLEKRNVSVIGPILLIRTKKGLSLLDTLAKPKKFWRAFGDVGIVLVLFGMAYMIFLVLVMDYIMLTSPPKPSPATSPRNILLIPGLNEFIPLVWGLIGLIVTLVAHEFSHAILARVENVRVKSLGVVLALIPIGGFAEPDDKELMEKEKRSRMRIYSAGITANFFTALVAFVIFFSLLGFLKPHVVVLKSFENFDEGDAIISINGYSVETPQDILNAVDDLKSVVVTVRKQDGRVLSFEVEPIMGVYIAGILNNTPAEMAGIKENSIIISVNRIRTPNVEEFRKIMLKTKPNETLTLEILEEGKIKTYTVRLAEMEGHGFLGVLIGGDYFSGAVVGYSKNIINSLTKIPPNIQGLLYLTAMPFYFRGFDGITNYFTPEGIFANLGNTIFYLLNTFYWIAWLNFYVGLFNCLPAIPLDGGRLLNDLLRYFMRENVVDTITKSLAFFVFFSIILSILIPNLNFT
ncbi:site-2 protease family protein [Archaeoglobus profundus]|uniref:Peptidase M50 n=1 Tax=Archaeoglobus profundus (strain DSM 5631 / JCM 9629 / NBRC 100127 / Av18) TaxID=572546 RepID=D2RDX6_ARCPA|nr:site-2 protease family protein [Archaeoglobus profundus]ADB58320.1 peptidase M50 [Archaeoglobus profundus DSM 5631]